MEIQKVKNERIDIRVTPEEKRVFIRARELSGDKSLSAFITRIVKMKAIEIIKNSERILAGERDKNIFFDAIYADLEPNATLKEAAEKYKSKKD